MTTRSQWASQLALRAGPKTIAFTHANLIALVAWASEENTRATWNPQASTEPWPGATVFNSSGVRNYPSLTAGLDATLATLRNGDYSVVLEKLANGGCACAVNEAVANSPWGTWYHDPVRAVAFTEYVAKVPTTYLNAAVAS
jgi:hypothetical protein